jgi:hypothetical protein
MCKSKTFLFSFPMINADFKFSELLKTVKSEKASDVKHKHQFM